MCDTHRESLHNNLYVNTGRDSKETVHRDSSRHVHRVIWLDKLILCSRMVSCVFTRCFWISLDYSPFHVVSRKGYEPAQRAGARIGLTSDSHLTDTAIRSDCMFSTPILARQFAKSPRKTSTLSVFQSIEHTVPPLALDRGRLCQI